MLTVTVNGEPRRIDEGTDVAALVRSLTGRDSATGVAVALNRTVLPRSRWQGRRLREGDTVEIIVPRGGG